MVWCIFRGDDTGYSFFSEIIPKTIGAIYWRRLARPVAYFIRALNLILLPLVWLSEQVTKLLSRKQEQHTARDELLAMARVGARNGAIASQAMLDLIANIHVNTAQEGSLIDLGSGWGTLVIAVARKYPHRQVIGYELSWLPWLVSLIRIYFLRLNNVTIYRRDFKDANLESASVLCCYLFPKAMLTIRRKLIHDHLNSMFIVSNTFALPLCEPMSVTRLNDFYRTPIYVYHWSCSCV